MFTEEFEIALHRVAMGMDELGLDYDDPDLFDIEDLLVPLDEYDDPDYMGASVPASLTFD